MLWFNLLMIAIMIVASFLLFMMALGFRRRPGGGIEHSVVTSIVVCTIFLIVFGFAYWIGFFWTFIIFFILIPLFLEVVRFLFRFL